MFKIKKPKTGALLIEVLLAITVMTGGLVLVTQSFMASLRATVYSYDYSLATLLAENKMTELLQKGPVKDGYQESKKFPEPYEKFQYELKAKNIRSGSEPGFSNQVDFEISWSSGKKEHKIPVTTFLPNFIENEQNAARP